MNGKALPLALLGVMALPVATAQDWSQWGRDATHRGVSESPGVRLQRVVASVVVDPFVADMKRRYGYLPVHYPVTLVDGKTIVTVEKSGTFTGIPTRHTQEWSVSTFVRTSAGLRRMWSVATDWKPAPHFGGTGGAILEQPYQCAIDGEAVWAPAAGGTMLKVNRVSGRISARVNPFGAAVDPQIFAVGGPVVDANRNVYYNAIRLHADRPWAEDVQNAWLVRISADGAVSTVSYSVLLPNAPKPSGLP